MVHYPSRKGILIKSTKIIVYSSSTVLIVSYFLFYIFYTADIKWDTMAAILLPIKYGVSFSSSHLLMHSLGLPILFYFINPSNPCLLLIILGVLVLLISIYIFNLSLKFFSIHWSVRLLSTIMWLSAIPTRHVSLRLDDNFYQIPFFMIAIYIILSVKYIPIKYYIAGLVFSIGAAIHIQIISMIPAIFIMSFLYDEKISHKNNYNAQLSNVAWLSLGVISVFPVIIIMCMIPLIKQNGLGVLFKLGSYSPYVSDSNIFFFASGKISNHNLLKWTLDWVRGLVANVSFYPGEWNKILRILWFPIFFGLQIYGLIKAIQNQKRKLVLFILCNLLAFGLTAIFAFCYEPASDERWVTGLPMCFLNLGIGIDYLYRKNKDIRRIAFGSLIILLLMGYITSAIYEKRKLGTLDWYAYPNYSVLKGIVDNVPNDSSLLMGSGYEWLSLSYYRSGRTIYYNKQFKEYQIWENGRMKEYIKNASLTWIKSYLNNKTVYIHQSAYEIINNEQNILNNYVISISKEYLGPSIGNKLFRIQHTERIYAIKEKK